MAQRSCLALSIAGGKVLVAAAALLVLQGCALFVADRRAPDDDLATGSITPHPVTAVASQSLAPLTASAPATTPPLPPARSAAPIPFAATGPAPISPPIGAVIAESDREAVRRTLEAALLDQEQAVRAPWLNAATGVGGLIVPVSGRQTMGDAVCRALRVSVIRGARTEWLGARGCLPTGGDWALVDVRPDAPPEG